MTFRRLSASFILPVILLTAPAWAEVIGHNLPSLPLDATRVAALPAAERALWTSYLQASDAHKAADKAALAAEHRGLASVPLPPAAGNGEASMPLNKPPEWYATPQARHIANVIVSFQTPAGGWGKNAPRDGQVRQPGQSYVIGDGWDYVGTFDNGATTTELKFLARVAEAVPDADGDVYRQAVLRGVEYLLTAQYPNGGWPQVWPLQGGYHDGITFNDNALIDIVGVLTRVARGEDGFAFVPQDLRSRAQAAADRALTCILDTQVRVDGALSVWGQQHDALTLQPMSARNFEPPALASTESASLLSYLMTIDNPSPRVVAAVHAGAAWLKAAALHDLAFVKSGNDRVLTPQAGAPPLWARFYDLQTGKPVFGDRDKTIHDDVAGISLERRLGYSWYNTAPQKALDAYAKWSQSHPR